MEVPIEYFQSAQIEELNDLFESKSPEELLQWAFNQFANRISFSCSFGLEDMALLDMILRLDPKTQVFTLDTGRLPDETYALIQRTREKYGIAVKVYFPESSEVEAMVETHGVNLFYKRVE
ncbi:MAG TPA: phosphoadenosine phosphosulfate reductase family protein, partial [Acidobacteriota bacterium]